MRKGGSFVVDKGTRKRVAGTSDHPEGNRARDADGAPVAPMRRAREKPARAAPAPAAPARSKTRED